MAYRLRRRTRRSTLRRRRPMRRRPMMRRRPRLSTLKIHHFKRNVQLGVVNTSAANQFFGYSFNLNQLPNATEFTNLFDCYRINKVVIRFVPNRNSAEFLTTSSSIPNVHSAIDNTDATAPASMNELYEYASWRMTRGTSIHTRILTPASLDVVNATAGSSASNPTYKQWISTSAPTVEHYGLKLGFEGATANTGNWIIYATYYFSCKSVK